MITKLEAIQEILFPLDPRTDVGSGDYIYGKIPSLDEIDFSDFENCPLEALPKKRNKKSDAQKPSTLYRLNGCPARGLGSEAAAQKGSIKILLKK